LVRRPIERTNADTSSGWRSIGVHRRGDAAVVGGAVGFAALGDTDPDIDVDADVREPPAPAGGGCVLGMRPAGA